MAPWLRPHDLKGKKAERTREARCYQQMHEWVIPMRAADGQRQSAVSRVVGCPQTPTDFVEGIFYAETDLEYMVDNRRTELLAAARFAHDSFCAITEIDALIDDSEAGTAEPTSDEGSSSNDSRSDSEVTPQAAPQGAPPSDDSEIVEIAVEEWPVVEAGYPPPPFGGLTPYMMGTMPLPTGGFPDPLMHAIMHHQMMAQMYHQAWMNMMLMGQQGVPPNVPPYLAPTNFIGDQSEDSEASTDEPTSDGGSSSDDGGSFSDASEVTPQAATQGALPISGRVWQFRCLWKKFADPISGRVWMFNEDTEESFFVDRPNPWSSYVAPGGRFWWWHASKPWFWDDLADQEPVTSGADEVEELGWVMS